VINHCKNMNLKEPGEPPLPGRKAPPMTEYVSTTDTAKLIRAALKKAFASTYPGVKFSVRSDKYAGGASVNVTWTDGPQIDAVDAVVKPYSGAGFDGMTDLKTSNSHWLYPDGRAERLESEIGHSYGSRVFDAEGDVIPEQERPEYRKGLRHAVEHEITDAEQVTPGPSWSLAFQLGVIDGARRLASGARLVHFMADYISTHRNMGPEYRAELEQAVVFLSGGEGPFDGSRRYEFGIIPEGEQAGRAYCDYGHTLVYQLSRTDPEALASALRDEAKRRALNNVTLFNAGHADDRTGYYVTARDGVKADALLGPYATREEAEADLATARQLAGQAGGDARWDAYGTARVTVKPGAAFFPGRLEHLPQRQMAAARITRPQPQAA
jgi:hypothetical protein